MSTVLRIEVSATSGTTVNPLTAFIGSTVPLSLNVAGRALAERLLATDDPWSVGFQGIAEGSVVLIQTDGPITAELTPTTGDPAVLPVDTLLVLSSKSNPFTALTITRTSTQDTNVTVIILEQA